MALLNQGACLSSANSTDTGTCIQDESASRALYYFVHISAALACVQWGAKSPRGLTWFLIFGTLAFPVTATLGIQIWDIHPFDSKVGLLEERNSRVCANTMAATRTGHNFTILSKFDFLRSLHSGGLAL